MTTDTAQPEIFNNIIWLLGLMVVGIVCLVYTLGDMAWAREYLKKSRERNKPPRNTYYFGMEHEVLVRPIVELARQQIDAGLNIFLLKSVQSDAQMREYGEKNNVPPGRIVHRTDTDVLYVYTGVENHDGLKWRPVRWTATQRYLSEVSRRAPSHAPPPEIKPIKPYVDFVSAKRKFLPINPAQE